MNLYAEAGGSVGGPLSSRLRPSLGAVCADPDLRDFAVAAPRQARDTIAAKVTGTPMVRVTRSSLNHNPRPSSHARLNACG